MRHYYTGVGSRSTPPQILKVMTRFAQIMADKDIWLHSGGAEGADQAFEAGASYKKWIFIPWDGFNGYGDTALKLGVVADSQEMTMIAMRSHPHWMRLSAGARKLHTRNVAQILGLDMKGKPELLICWTPDGCIGKASRTVESGGTATAIIIAEEHNVPILNLRRKDHLVRVINMIKKHRRLESTA